MKINDYYRDAAQMYLNGSIAALIPTILIIAGNLSFFKHQLFMGLTIPFFLYSLILFQLYLFRKKQSITISRNLNNVSVKNKMKTLFNADHLLVFFRSTSSPILFFFLPDGRLAGYISQKKRSFRSGVEKIYVLQNALEEPIGFFKVYKNANIKIEVFDCKQNYLGCFEKRKLSWRKSKKELWGPAGSFMAAVEGSTAFMDEQIINSHHFRSGRLRRGWMPVEWGSLFPEPNTPVFSFIETNSDQDKLLQLSFLINEYFIER